MDWRRVRTRGRKARFTSGCSGAGTNRIGNAPATDAWPPRRRGTHWTNRRLRWGNERGEGNARRVRFSGPVIRQLSEEITGPLKRTLRSLAFAHAPLPRYTRLSIES